MIDASAARIPSMIPAIIAHGQEGEHGAAIVPHHMTDAPPSIVTCSTEWKVAHHPAIRLRWFVAPGRV
jgi:hypothetical protein